MEKENHFFVLFSIYCKGENSEVNSNKRISQLTATGYIRSKEKTSFS